MQFTKEKIIEIIIIIAVTTILIASLLYFNSESHRANSVANRLDSLIEQSIETANTIKDIDKKFKDTYTEFKELPKRYQIIIEKKLKEKYKDKLNLFDNYNSYEEDYNFSL